jgi:hypothetical protein
VSSEANLWCRHVAILQPVDAVVTAAGKVTV